MTNVRATLWQVGALAIVVLLPTQYRDSWPVWKSTPELMVQALFGGLGFLLAALLAGARTGAFIRGALRAALAVSVSFGLLAALSLVLPALPMSRLLLVFGAALSLVILIAQQLTGLPSTLVFIGLLGIASGVGAAGRRSTASEDFSIDTQYYLLRVRVHRTRDLARDLDIEGGGLSRMGRRMLHVTGAGRFSLLTLGADGGLVISPILLSTPANAQAFRDEAGEDAHPEWFRVMDLLAEEDGDSVRVLASHHHWNSDKRCFTVRVSKTSAPASLDVWTPWQPLFDARPCLQLKRKARGLPFQGPASGGRMLRVADGVLLTVGDHQFDGLNAAENLPQDPESDFGKLVLLRADGSSFVYSSGHRNPQGLALDASGTVWETEHGPRGGDEINLIERGANYGWPFRTHGTEYALREWPLLRPASADFREPRLAFVPSPGISNLIAPRTERFAAWSSSLLVGTLKARELLRVQLDGDRPVYVEEIRVRFELRDLAEAEDGTLVAWTDEGALLTIRPSEDERSGAALALRCAGCHTMNEGQLGALGPNLFGIIGRRVGASSDFGYSAALRRYGGRWTPARLDAFIANPEQAAPGTSMAFEGIRDSNERRLLIEYLANSSARR